MEKEFNLVIRQIIPRTYNVKSVRLNVEEWVDFKAGQYLIAKLNDNPALTKPLSISSSPTAAGMIEFTKKITESEFSQALNGLMPGDSVKIRYPFGKFTLDERYKKIAFISGGIGITPIKSITRYIVDKRMDIDSVLIYANRTVKDIAFKDDFDIMQRDFPGLKVTHILSQAESGWKGRTGHINSQVIKEEIPDYTQRKFYLCGPPAMVEVMEKCLLEDLNLAKDSIITENFKGY